MAIAVASVSAMASSNYPTNSVTVTAPTGITTGDLLLIIAAGTGNGTTIGGYLNNWTSNQGVASCTGFTECYFHSRDVNVNSGVGGVARVNVLYKIAVAADQTAPNYTVTHSSYGGGAAIMFRITGWSTGDPLAHRLQYIPAGNPVDAMGTTIPTTVPYTYHNQDGSDTLAWNGTAYRPSQQVMIMYVTTAGDEDGGFIYSNYSSVPSATWTEAGDTTYNITDYDGGALGVAYATTSATTDITHFDVYKTYDSSDGNETTVMGILQIFTPMNASGTVARINTSPAYIDNTGLADSSGTVARINKTATFPGASGTGTGDTVWTARSKNSTTWTARS